MPKITVGIANFTLTSSWTGSGNPSTAKEKKTVDVSSILAGSTINSAKLTCSYAQGFWGGTLTIGGTVYSSGEVDVKNCISSPATGTTMEIEFTYKCEKIGYTNDGGSHSSSGSVSSISIEIDYTLPYTSCTPPSSVTAANTDVAPGATVRVSWSGASGGTNNAIASYTVYRSTDNANWTELRSGVTNAYLDVTAPTANGSTYYYTVKTVGSVAGYDSARSTATASVKCSFSAPSVSNVKIDSSANDVYKTASAPATLSWTGSNGTNNAISKYKIQRNGVDWQETTATSYSIAAHSTAGQSYYYTVIPIGAHSNGTGVNSPTLYTYSAPTAPTSVSVEKTNVAPGVSVKLSWSGAKTGDYNAISGYRIMRATSANGTYSQVGNDISTTAAYGSVNVTSHATNGSSYFYKVITLGVRSNSVQSSVYAQLKTVWTAPSVSNVKLDGSADHQYRTSGAALTLSWTGNNGTNNAISKYEVYRNGTKLGETTGLSYSVSAHATGGSSYYFQVKPIGALGDGSLSDSIYVYTYDACSAPSTVTLAKNNVAPSSSVTLSWSGATAGNYNAIKGYRIMRSTSQNGTYTKLGDDITSTATSGSVSVTSHTSNGGVYYYKVVTLGNRQDSGQSSAVALTTSFSNPSVSALKLDSSASDQYRKPSENLTLTWTGTNGTNNAISKYEIYRDGTKLGDTTEASYQVSSHSTGGKKYTYTVKAIAPLGNSDLSSGISVYTYTDPSAPTVVSVQSNNVAPSTTIRLSWSGAAGGSLNAIAGYRVMRATSASGTYSKIGSDITTTETSGSMNVTSNSSNGSKYYYKVITIGARSNSGQSSNYAELTTYWTNPYVFALKLDNSSDAQYRTAGASLTLSWTGANGTNNTIQKYEVYRNGSKLGETTSSSYSVSAHATAGQNYYFQVKAVGQRGDSDLSGSITVYTYSAPSAPASVTVANSEPDAGGETTLSWSGAQNGSYNNITGYRVFRSTSAAGTYTQYGNDLAANASSMSVPAPDTMGSSYYYKVMALGARSNSAQSAAAQVTAKTYSAVTAPTSVSVDDATPDASSQTTLRWTGAQNGTNNPITGYRVYRATSQNGTYTQLGNDLAANVSSLAITAPSAMGESYWYKVYTLGTKAGFTPSAASQSVSITAQTYTQCTEPVVVEISESLANPGEVITISWHGAKAGRNNPISRYDVYRSINGGSYTLFKYTASTREYISDTVGPSGDTYSYKIITRGTVSGYDSLASAIVSVKSNTPPGRISSFVEPESIYENGILQITWTAPEDADANIDHYSIQYRQQSTGGTWGEWIQLSVTTACRFEDQPTVARGLKFQYRVCAVDTLSLSGDYAETQVFTKNSTPITPRILLPSNGAITLDNRPAFFLEIYNEPDGQMQYAYVSVDGGGFVLSANVGAEARQVAIRCPVNVSVGNRHEISIRLLDSLGAASQTVSITVQVNNNTWDREIASGTLISKAGPSFVGDSLRMPSDSIYTNDVITITRASFSENVLVIEDYAGISHQSEIEELYARTNIVRTYYGLSSISVPASVGENYANAGSGKIGMFAAWGTQMRTLQQALTDIYHAISVDAPAWINATDGMHPRADVLNQIRSTILNL